MGGLSLRAALVTPVHCSWKMTHHHNVKLYSYLKKYNIWLHFELAFRGSGVGEDGDPQGPGQDLHSQGDQEFCVLLVRRPEQLLG